MKRLYWSILLVVAIASAGFVLGTRLALPLITVTGETLPPTDPDALFVAASPAPDQLQAVLQEALESEVQAKSPEVSAFLIYSVEVYRTFLSDDGQSAFLWLALRDPETGEILATEPGYAVARLADAAKGPQGWDITLQSEPGFAEQVAALPAGLVSAEIREQISGMTPEEQPLDTKSAEVYSGYKLPWAGGLSKRLTQSISHLQTSCQNIPTCVYAFDFADGTMFPLLAAKGGTVKAWRTTCGNGDPTCTNYLILEDRSTSPTTYQLYYHMAHESIPAALRVVGAPVLQGQFIGNVDDTGNSTGHHLHFHVTKNATSPYFANIVDITFDDVDINGGRPRLCSEASSCRTSYVSGNWGAFPPDGSISAPAANTTLTSSAFSIAGTVSDDQGVTQVVAIVNSGSGWREASGPLTLSDNRFSGSVDLCANAIGDTSFQLALRIWDREGNQTQNYPGQRTLTGRATCVFTGGINAPLAGATVSGSTLTVSGSASASAGLGSVKVWIHQDGLGWKDFPVTVPANSSTLSINQGVNLCAAGFTTGPLTLRLEVLDKAGNALPDTTGLRVISSRNGCQPAPRCLPASNQAAVFSGPNFTGDCRVFDPGTFTSLSPLAIDDIESVRVGSGAHLTLYDNPNATGRAEAFTPPGDANLADNPLGPNRAAAVRVQVLHELPSQFAPPPQPVQANPSVQLGRAPTTNDSIVLTWSPSPGASLYQSRLTYPDGHGVSLAWQRGTSWSVGNLPAGTYTWWVMAGTYINLNPVSAYERRSTYNAITYTVQPATAPGGTAQTLPFSDDLDAIGGWTATGQWHQAGDLRDGVSGFGFNSGAGYSGTLSGDLTSPPIRIDGPAYLQFRYWNSTEDNGPWWDQRRVQISANGGPFTDLALLAGDGAGVWLNSQPIDLAAYAGQTVRIRFQFSALDSANNDFEGWLIDRVDVLAGTPSGPCLESAPNNSLATATAITVGSTYNRLVCPGGDVDFFRFSGAAGDRLSIDVTAMAAGSPLDPVLTLFDEAGNLILENDDIVAGELRDPHLSYVLPDARAYYLRVRAWDHPSAGDSNYSYALRVLKDSGAPSLTFTGPKDSPRLSLPAAVTATASDQGSPLRVNFYVHTADWLTGNWRYVGTDYNGADGWSFPLEPSLISGDTVCGLYVEAEDGAGNKAGDVNLYECGVSVYLPFTRR